MGIGRPLADRKGKEFCELPKETNSKAKKNRRRQKKLSPVQKLYETCKQVFASGGTGIVPPPADVERLRLVLDRMKPEDVGLTPEMPYFRTTMSQRTPTITYLHLYQCDKFSIGIFCLPQLGVIPLHNHPGMTVFSKLLFGTMHIKSYDWVVDVPCNPTANVNHAEIEPPEVRLAKVKVDSDFTAPNTSILYPAAGGNMHCFTALTACAVLDVLGPPYSDPDGRHCTYYLDSPFADFSGPGCSSLGFGAFKEHGPFQPGEDGLLVKNQYSWNLESNMLYVESPIGVGFSYSNTSSNYFWNDTRTAADNLRFIVNWLEEFPQYKDSDFFLTGESYAGHYIPQLAALLLDYNKKPNIRPIKLKAIALGNPLLDLDISILAGDYLWSHGAISDETLMLEKTVCNDSKYLREYYHDKWSQGCNDVFNRVSDEIGVDVPHDDLLLPKCLSSNPAEQFKLRGKHGKIHATIARRGTKGDPCLGERIFTYLNKPQVQKALHANTTNLPFHWDFCLGPLVYQEDNIDMNLIPLIADILKEGIPILLFSGDQDSLIPLTQTRIIANNLAKDLKLLPFTTYAPWYDKKQVGGWSQSFGGLRDGKNVTYLTFATVRGAAHEVPFTSPSQALTLFRSFINGSALPRPHD